MGGLRDDGCRGTQVVARMATENVLECAADNAVGNLGYRRCIRRGEARRFCLDHLPDDLAEYRATFEQLVDELIERVAWVCV